MALAPIADEKNANADDALITSPGDTLLVVCTPTDATLENISWCEH